MKTWFTSYPFELFVLFGSYFFWLTGQGLDDSYIVCVIVLAYYGLRFMMELGKRIVFIDAVILMAIMQWLFVTVIVYKIESEMVVFEEIYSEMPIDQKRYFGIAFPATFLFFAGLHLPVIKVRYDAAHYKKLFKEYIKDMPWVPVGLFGVGFFVKMTAVYLPIPGFLAFLLENVMYVGFFYALFVKTKYNIFIFSITIGLMLLSILGGALSTFVLWSIFIAVLIFMVKNIPLWAKLGLLSIAMGAIFILQSVKTAYREVVWRGEGVNYTSAQKFNLFVEMIGEKFSGEADEEASEESSHENLIRFNQGFLTAHAIDYVPAVEPFAAGETVMTALLASFIPRVLWPDKPVSGGRENMHRFTRLRMVGTTSMNISALGDGYVNYGPVGAAVFLFIFGLSLNLLNGTFLKKAQKTPSLILWMPTVYIAVVVVETDFVTVFNHAIKSSVFIALVYYCTKKFLGMKL